MTVLVARLVTFVCALALVAAATAPCSGWTAAPETRLACCTSHCPMEQAGGHHGTHEPVQQSDADSCCAMSEHRDAAPAAGLVATAITLIPMPGPAALPGPASPRDAWRTTAPLPIRSISTHLLLSVLLV